MWHVNISIKDSIGLCKARANPGVWPCGCALQRPIGYSQRPVSWPSQSHQQPAWQDKLSPKSLPGSHSDEESPQRQHTGPRKIDASQTQPRHFPRPRSAGPVRTLRMAPYALERSTDTFRLSAMACSRRLELSFGSPCMNRFTSAQRL